MKYCTNCHRITTGDPLFCNICGNSYNIKLCPRLHPNPRAAQICSQCGSHDLSTPHPKGGLATIPATLLLRILPGIALALTTAAFLLALLWAAIGAREVLIPLLVKAGVLLGAVWILYWMLPEFVRGLINVFGRRPKHGSSHRSDHKGSGSHH